MILKNSVVGSILIFVFISMNLLIVDAQEKVANQSKELPVNRIPHNGEAAEAYLSPDGFHLICDAKLEGEDNIHVYTLNIDGTEMCRINDKGVDACSYYFPDGNKLIWTSTRDSFDCPDDSYSDPLHYPQGAELFISDLDGNILKRLTNNDYYDAEVSVSPNGDSILFTRQIDGKSDLWRMNTDGSGEFQITHTPDWQEGGSFYMPDNETIVYRAWKIEDQGKRSFPMTLFTINKDGTGRRALTHDDGTNWSPYPAPDGKHIVFVKVLNEPNKPPNYEIFLLNIETGEQRRLTYNKAFDAFPTISKDGKTMVFSSSRDAKPGERKLFLYTMDISSLNLGIFN